MMMTMMMAVVLVSCVLVVYNQLVALPARTTFGTSTRYSNRRLAWRTDPKVQSEGNSRRAPTCCCLYSDIPPSIVHYSMHVASALHKVPLGAAAGFACVQVNGVL